MSRKNDIVELPAVGVQQAVFSHIFDPLYAISCAISCTIGLKIVHTM